MYEFHRYANLFPLMEGPEFAELVEDIRANGLHEPIMLHEGKILDGRATATLPVRRLTSRRGSCSSATSRHRP
jgi:hypothetical protein